MKLVTIFEYPELKALQSAVLVEMYNRVISTGTGKRKFNESFTESEQEQIKRFYKLFYGWHFLRIGGTGIPKTHQMTIVTYELMKRAINFFGTY